MSWFWILLMRLSCSAWNSDKKWNDSLPKQPLVIQFWQFGLAKEVILVKSLSISVIKEKQTVLSNTHISEIMAHSFLSTCIEALQKNHDTSNSKSPKIDYGCLYRQPVDYSACHKKQQLRSVAKGSPQYIAQWFKHRNCLLQIASAEWSQFLIYKQQI